MHCFYHPDTPAVLLCKSCLKGLCYTCARESSLGHTCGDEACSQRARTMDRIIDANKTITSVTKSQMGALRSALLVLGLAGLMLAYVARHRPALCGLAGFVGLLSLLASVSLGRMHQRMPDLSKDDDAPAPEEKPDPQQATF